MEDKHVNEVLIDTEEISEYLFDALVEFGLVPTEEEVDLIADLMFDFLIAKSFIDEEIIEED